MKVRRGTFSKGAGPAIAALLLALAGALVLPGCRGEGAQGAADLDLRLSIAPTPPTVGEARIVITIDDPSGQPAEAEEVIMEGTMTHAGMAPVRAEAMRQSTGRWVIDAFPFPMAGDWVLSARVFDAGELKTVHEQSVRVVGAEMAPVPPPGNP